MGHNVSHHSESPVRRRGSPNERSPLYRERSPGRHRSSHKGSSPVRENSPQHRSSYRDHSLEREKHSGHTKSPEHASPHSSFSRSPSRRTKRLRRAQAEKEVEKEKESEYERNHSRGSKRSTHKERAPGTERASEREKGLERKLGADGKHRWSGRDDTNSKSSRGRHEPFVSPTDSNHSSRHRSRSPASNSRARDEVTNSRGSEQRIDEDDSIARMKAAEEALEAKEQIRHNYIMPNAQNHSVAINAYSKWKLLEDFPRVLQASGALQLFSNSCFGHFLGFHSKAVFSATMIHNILAREIMIDNAVDQEFWFGLGQHKVRFGKREFCLVTGLRFSGGDDIDFDGLAPVAGGILERFFGVGDIDVTRLATRFKEGGFETAQDAYKIALVTFVCCILFGPDYRAFAPLWVFHLVENTMQFNTFPWGKYSYEMTCHYLRSGIRSCKFIPGELSRYHLYGLSWALQIWAFEAIPAVARIFKDARVEPSEESRRPRFLNWKFPKKFVDISEVFTDNMDARETLEPTVEEVVEGYWVGIDAAITEGRIHYVPPEHIVGQSQQAQMKKRKTTARDGAQKKLCASQLAQMTRSQSDLATQEARSAPDTTQLETNIPDSQQPTKKKEKKKFRKIRQIVREEVEAVVEHKEKKKYRKIRQVVREEVEAVVERQISYIEEEVVQSLGEHINHVVAEHIDGLFQRITTWLGQRNQPYFVPPPSSDPRPSLPSSFPCP
ncbi:hypothetical protein DITRI_Ditri14bG0132300 [Diplodiscus trichospermus]